VSVLIYDRAVVAGLKRVQDGYLRNVENVTLEDRSKLRLGKRALENIARLNSSLL
jgi:hypothetical protein